MQLHPDLGSYTALPDIVNQAAEAKAENDASVQEAKWARDVLARKLPAVTDGSSDQSVAVPSRNGSSERTPENRAKWERARQARATGEACADCGQVFELEDTVVLVRRRAYEEHSWGLLAAPVCDPCWRAEAEDEVQRHLKLVATKRDYDRYRRDWERIGRSEELIVAELARFRANDDRNRSYWAEPRNVERERHRRLREVAYGYVAGYGPSFESVPCAGCGKPVIGGGRTNRHHVTCSDRCKGRVYHPAVTHVQQSCDVCGDEFVPVRDDARYCSPACRQRAYRDRRRLADDAQTSSAT
jgi:hypothetical protein